MVSGKIESHLGEAVVLATGGYGNVFYLSTNAMGCNATATWRAHRKGALFANPCYTQIHPTCIPVAGEFQSKLTLMSESLRNDGACGRRRRRNNRQSPRDPEADRDYYRSASSELRNLVPRDISSRNAKTSATGPASARGLGVYLDFSDSIARLGKGKVQERYGNLFDMYQRITGDDPYSTPMRIFPAIHYTMGGLWVDYNLMSTIPGMFVGGEANFSDHGANRLGASALMQGLADGYFVLPSTVANYVAKIAAEGTLSKKPTNPPRGASGRGRCVSSGWSAYGDQGQCAPGLVPPRARPALLGALRHGAQRGGPAQAGSRASPSCAGVLPNLSVLGTPDGLNQSLEKAARVADFLELGELMARDALMRRESCGGHFRLESQTEEGEAKRDDENFQYAAAWEFRGDDKGRMLEPALHKEALEFEYVKPRRELQV